MTENGDKLITRNELLFVTLWPRPEPSADARRPRMVGHVNLSVKAGRSRDMSFAGGAEPTLEI